MKHYVMFKFSEKIDPVALSGDMQKNLGALSQKVSGLNSISAIPNCNTERENNMDLMLCYDFATLEDCKNFLKGSVHSSMSGDNSLAVEQIVTFDCEEG